MNIKLFLLFSFLIITNLNSFAQLQRVDVRDLAMGNATVGCIPSYGPAKNSSYIQSDKKSIINLTASNNFFIKDLSPAFLSFYKSFNERTAIYSDIGKIGNKSFSEQFIETGISKKLGQKFYASILIQYHQWIINESIYENSHALVPLVGLFTIPIKNLCFGVLIRNPVRVRMNAIEQNKLPVEINTGISYKVSEKVLIAISAKQRSQQVLSTHLGLEYIFHSNLYFRFGWQTLPVSESFGFGLKLNRIYLDMAIKTHPTLGNSSSVSLTFSL